MDQCNKGSMVDIQIIVPGILFQKTDINCKFKLKYKTRKWSIDLTDINNKKIRKQTEIIVTYRKILNLLLQLRNCDNEIPIFEREYNEK